MNKLCKVENDISFLSIGRKNGFGAKPKYSINQKVHFIHNGKSLSGTIKDVPTEAHPDYVITLDKAQGNIKEIYGIAEENITLNYTVDSSCKNKIITPNLGTSVPWNDNFKNLNVNGTNYELIQRKRGTFYDTYVKHNGKDYQLKIYGKTYFFILHGPLGSPETILCGKIVDKKQPKITGNASPLTRRQSGSSSSGEEDTSPARPGSKKGRRGELKTPPSIKLDLDRAFTPTETYVRSDIIKNLKEFKNVKIGNILIWIKNKEFYYGIVTGLYFNKHDNEYVFIILFHDADIYYAKFENFSFINLFINNEIENVFYIVPGFLNISNDLYDLTKFSIEKSTADIIKSDDKEINIFIKTNFSNDLNKIKTFGEKLKQNEEEEYNNWKKEKKPKEFTFNLTDNTKENFKRIFIADQFKDFIYNNPAWTKPELKDKQKNILENLLNDLKVPYAFNNFNPIYYVKELLKNDITSIQLTELFTILKLEKEVYNKIDITNFLTVLLILTKKGTLSELNKIKNKSANFINTFLSSIINKNKTDILFSVDALSSTSNISEFIKIINNYNSRTFTSPATYADGATTDSLTKQFYSQKKVDYTSLLKDEIKMKIPDLLNFTFKRPDKKDNFKYDVIIDEFGIIKYCGKINSKNGKYTIQNSILNIEPILEKIKISKPLNDVTKQLIVNDLCEKSSKTIMDLSKVLFFLLYIEKNKNELTIFFTNDKILSFIAKYLLKEQSTVVYASSDTSTSLQGYGKFEIIFTKDELDQIKKGTGELSKPSEPGPSEPGPSGLWGTCERFVGRLRDVCMKYVTKPGPSRTVTYTGSNIRNIDGTFVSVDAPPVTLYRAHAGGGGYCLYNSLNALTNTRNSFDIIKRVFDIFTESNNISEFKKILRGSFTDISNENMGILYDFLDSSRNDIDVFLNKKGPQWMWGTETMIVTFMAISGYTIISVGTGGRANELDFFEGNRETLYLYNIGNNHFEPLFLNPAVANEVDRKYFQQTQMEFGKVKINSVNADIIYLSKK